MIRLAARSAWNRRFVLALVVGSIALSTLLLTGIERIRSGVRSHFTQSVSGTDLIVGARTGAEQLLLFSVFRIGQATNPMRWSSVQAIDEMPAVAWTVPISLGDSYRGFAVVGTTPEYFSRFRYGDRQALELAQGHPFDAVYEVVLGADVAAQRGLGLGDAVVLAHGDGTFASHDHADKPFTVVGILARTGTPVDRSLHIPLAGIEAIHIDWIAGAPLPGHHVDAAHALEEDLTPKAVTALLVGLKERTAVFALQRRIQEFADEPLMAVLPAVALDGLWTLLGGFERALWVMSGLVAVVSFAGLVAVILAGLNERRRELAILRAVGASPRDLFALLALEAFFVTFVGVALGVGAGQALLVAAGPWLQATVGLALPAGAPSTIEWALIGGLVGAGVAAGLLPGWRAYRMTLADGLSPRV